MVTTSEPAALPLSQAEQLGQARRVLALEAQALEAVRDRLDRSFCQAVHLMYRTSAAGGSVIVTGMGKAGLVGQKIAATLASTGTRAHPVHPAEAVHGDLGRIGPSDVVLALSFSGRTSEVLRLIGPVHDLGSQIVAITASADSPLGRLADVTIALGRLVEACPLGLAPSASTTAMMAVGDALAFVLSHLRGFQTEQFARFHPAGNLGRLSGPVDELMRTGEQVRMAHQSATVRQALVENHRQGRRTGAIVLVDDAGRLQGLFTDSDLARLLERRCDAALDRPIAEWMTRDPTVVSSGTPVQEAIALLSKHKFSQLPVVDAQQRPVGIVDITDLIGLMPELAGEVPEATTADGGPQQRQAA